MQAKGIDRSINETFRPVRDLRTLQIQIYFFKIEGSEKRRYLHKVIKLINSGARTMFFYFQYNAFSTLTQSKVLWG